MRADSKVTRQNLIDAFCILIRKKPVQKITVRELVDKAGYNRGTFYKYFRDVYEVLEQIEALVLDRIKENFRSKIKPENFEQTFLDAFTAIQREQAVYFEILLSSANSIRFVEKLLKEISPVFMETFLLPPEDSRSKYLTEIYLVTVITAVKLWLNDGRHPSAAELSKFIGEVLSHGVLPVIKSKRLETLSEA